MALVKLAASGCSRKSESDATMIVPLEKRVTRGWMLMNGRLWAVGIVSRLSGYTLASPISCAHQHIWRAPFRYSRVARRDAARAKFEQKREEKMSGTRERAAAMREKDKATMDMFMQMAKQKFG